MHFAFEARGFCPIGAAHHGGEPGVFIMQRDAAPDADRIAPVCRFAGAIESDGFNRLAIDQQLGLLPGTVAYHGAHGGCAGVVIHGGEQETIRTVAHGQPVGVATGGGLVADGRRRAGRGLGQACGIGLRNRQNRGKIRDNKASARADDEARTGTASAAGGARAILELTALRKGVAQRLDNMAARHQTFEVIAAILVGDGKAAVLQNHAHAGDAAVGTIGGAPAIGNPADQRHAAAQAFILDPDRRAGHAFPAQRIAGHGPVQRLARRGVCPDNHGIGKGTGGTRRNVAEAHGQHPAIGCDGNRIGRRCAIDADGVLAQAQPG